MISLMIINKLILINKMIKIKKYLMDKIYRMFIKLKVISKKMINKIITHLNRILINKIHL